MIHWPCRQCGEELEAPDSLASEAVECPSCGTFSRMPDEMRPRVVTAPEINPKPKIADRNMASTEDTNTHQPAIRPPSMMPLADQRAISKGLTAWGSVLVLVGMIMGTNGFLLDTAPEGVHNTGLLNEQIIFVIAGTGAFVVGALLLGLGAIVKALVVKDADAKPSDRSWSELTWALIGIVIVFVFVTALMLISRVNA